ncbi:hypothetical protein TWF694_000250 [Orbilia ellipsospora]|uniref:O-methylsterigmatocystin oxidoreductase n=1 Tax=Orbilia ellipsospora TaxID=2528407 RepID=A0AAV9XN11_9PEZI
MVLLSLLYPWGIIPLVACIFYINRRKQRRLPPGPKPLPVVGNIRDFPPDGTPEFQHWLKHKEVYGPISSVTVLGTTLVIIHDRNAVQYLLEKTASKTSGRPEMVFANKMCGYESIVLCQGYHDKFRHCRKLLHRELGTSVKAAQFAEAQELEVDRQLVRALEQPQKWLDHFQTTSSATVLKMAYGYNIDREKPDRLVSLIDRMMTEFSLAAAPMAWMVDIIPALQYLPEGFPGAQFQRIAREWRKSIEAAAYIPYGFVQRQMAKDQYQPSYVSKLVEQCKIEGSSEGKCLNYDDEEAIIWTAASLYGAAADTTTITLSAFTLAMVLFPEVQRKAQEEIDRVIGTGRLPRVADRVNLPYVDAVVKETLRWWPIAPMGFPHTADEDIEYNDYLIPKGAYLLPAVWWFLHDPEVYANPEAFDPERFLAPRNEPDPVSDAFGYGRRICPGRFFADTGLYLSIANSLAIFNIGKSVTENGNEIAVEAKAKPGILNYVGKFQFHVTPRSQEHIDIVKRLEMELPQEEHDADALDLSVLN